MRLGRSPAAVPSDLTIHVIAGKSSNGACYRERDCADCDLETMTADIMSGEVDDVVRVLAFNPFEGWSRDVSEDVAIDIARRAQDPRQHDTLPADLLDVIEEHLYAAAAA